MEDRLSDRAAAAGLCETFSYPFLDHAAEEAGFAAWIQASGGGAPPLSLSNPLDESRKELRQTLLPGLLDALSRNVRHGAAGAALFESARGFGRKGEPARPDSFEDRRFAFALTGQARAHWSVPAESREFDFFDAKGIFEGLVSPWAPPETIRWSAFADSGFAAGATALARTGGGEVLGVVGLLDGSETEPRRLTGDVFAGEFLVAALPRQDSRALFAPYSTYPPIAADISFSHPREAGWERIARFVEGLAIANLERLEVVDRYAGSGVPEGRVKTTLRLTFRAADRTLEQDEVNRERDRLAAALERELRASF
jgi:phenylalanyl-tRNA synthetase beta chain